MTQALSVKLNKSNDVETAFASSTAVFFFFLVIFDNVHVDPNDHAAQFAYIQMHPH